MKNGNLIAISSNKSTSRGDQIPMQKASLDIWDKKYRLKSRAGEVIDHGWAAYGHDGQIICGRPPSSCRRNLSIGIS